MNTVTVGKGVAVAPGKGAGMAEFTYTGESGYKGINIGYTEVDGTYDSCYYLYHNGELIDWWVGQYDAVEDAGWVRDSLTFRDVKTTASNELIRKITPVNTDMSASFNVPLNEFNASM